MKHTENSLLIATCRAFVIFWIVSQICIAQVYITTGQTGTNGKLPGQWTVAPGVVTPSSFAFGGGLFNMGVTAGYTYRLNIRQGTSSGTLLGTVSHTAAELCPSGCSGFNNHSFTLPTPLTFSSPNSYYVEIIGLDRNGVPESGSSAPDGLKNPTTFSWVKPDGMVIDLTIVRAPDSPSGVTGTAGNGQISVNFTAPAVNGGSVITSYLATAVPHAGGMALIASCAASATFCTIPGLTNGTAYDVSVQAVNIIGPGTAASASNNPVIPSTIVPATNFSFTGPAGGTLNALSGTFTVTPNSVYTGTITITPTGGGLSSPIVLTFNNSSASQTFAITPTAVGPVILTPSNSGSLSNPPALTYATPPAAPMIGTAIAGDGSVTVSFMAPASSGGSPITGYTATCNPGGVTATVAGSPITLGGLTNGTAYTCTVTAANAFGTSALSNASNTVTPIAPATNFSFIGPAGGTLNALSGTFTVTPNSVYTGTITITPTGGGLSGPIVLTFNNSSASQTFAITPTAIGPVILTPSNSGSLSNPPALTYATPPAAPMIGTAIAGDGSVTVSFMAPASSGGSPITGYTATCNPGGVTATVAGSPITLGGLTNGTAYTCTVTAANAFGTSTLSNASNLVTPRVPTSGFSFTGPAGGALSAPSANFTVTPNSVYTGTITITPTGGGLSSPIVLTFNNSSASQTFTITPTTVGPVILTTSNSGSLSNPPVLAYATPPAPPLIGTARASGNGSLKVMFMPPESNGGSPVTGYTATCHPGGGDGHRDGESNYGEWAQ